MSVRWIVANICAGCIAVPSGAVVFIAVFSLLQLIAALLFGNYDGRMLITSTLLCSALGITGALVGAIIGVFQYLALSNTMPSALRNAWLLTTIVGATTGTTSFVLLLIFSGFYGVLPLLTMGALGLGWGLALYQGLLLQRVWSHGWWWSITSGIGWTGAALLLSNPSWIAIVLSSGVHALSTVVVLRRYHSYALQQGDQ